MNTITDYLVLFITASVGIFGFLGIISLSSVIHWNNIGRPKKQNLFLEFGLVYIRNQEYRFIFSLFLSFGYLLPTIIWLIDIQNKFYQSLSMAMLLILSFCYVFYKAIKNTPQVLS